MSTNFPGGTFAYQKVTPSEDAAVRRAALGDGILHGCDFSYSGSTLTMSAGLLFLCGRVVRHPQAQHWSAANAASGFARLLLTIDLSRTATADVFDQVVDTIEYADTVEGFAPLVQEEINESGIRYQVAVCVVSIGSNGITGIVQTLGVLDGKVKIPEVSSLAQLDSLFTSGSCPMNITSGNAVVGGVSFSRATVLVEGYDASTARQTLSLVGSTTQAVRSSNAGVWGAWSISNPPMELGVEYRTVELWEGEPVYIKRVAYAADTFKSQNLSLPHNISGLGICISADTVWKCTNSTPDGWRYLPASFWAGMDWNGQVNYVDAQNINFRIGDSLLSRIQVSTEPVYVTFKYTKL